MSSNVLEIDAIGVDEWEHEQHTPRAMDENLAALVKQSSTAQSGPVRAPTVDDEWEADAAAAGTPAAPGPAKQRTTTNTVSRPAPPKTKTLTIPAVVPKAAAAPKPSVAPRPLARMETKSIVSPAAKKPEAKPLASPPINDGPPPGFVEVKPRAARASAPAPARSPSPSPERRSTAMPPVKLAPAPAPQPIAAAAVVAVAEPKPEPIAPPQPAPVPYSPMALPAWPPVSTDVKPELQPEAKPEPSVIVDLGVAPPPPPPAVEVPRPQSYPVIPTQPAALQAWNTPLPQRLPDEPIAAPAAPTWPSAASLVHDPAAEPTATRTPLVRRRGVVIAIAAAAVIAIVIAISASNSHDSADSKQPALAAATSAPKPDPTTARAPAAAPAAASPAPAASTTVAVAAPVDPIAPSTSTSPSPSPKAKAPTTAHRISRSRKPVVVDYDKKPVSSPLDDDQALAQARAIYSIGNQHLFAGEGRDAITEYRKALAIYPSYAAGYRGLGLAFTQLDDKPSAVAAFKTYVKLAPSAKDVALIQKRIRNLSVR